MSDVDAWLKAATRFKCHALNAQITESQCKAMIARAKVDPALRWECYGCERSGLKDVPERGQCMICGKPTVSSWHCLLCKRKRQWQIRK